MNNGWVDEYPQRKAKGHLLGHLMRFGRLLRLMGVTVSLNQLLELARGLEHVAIIHKGDFYAAARAMLIVRHEEYELFDQAFRLYWRSPEPFAIDETKRKNEPPRQMPRLPGFLTPMVAAKEEEEEREEDVPSYSATEVLREKDFAKMTWEEVQAAKVALTKMAWKVSERRTRRSKLATAGRKMDLRRVTRDNLRYGGEPVVLRWRERKTKPRPIVLLCDISGSMERYSRMLVHFMHAFSHDMHDVETFVFGTRLTRITHHLRFKDVDVALDEVSTAVEDWSGGTKIGEAIKTFNYKWARRVLGRGAVVIVISDGLDRGNVDELRHEMGRLQRSSHRLIWLNPLMGMKGYEPIQRGMAAALPHIDDFLTVHNLESIAQLADVLGEIGERRVERKQVKGN